MTSASIVIPTRERLAYLDVALASIAPQALALDAEVLVVDDAGGAEGAQELARGHGARCLAHARPLGLNAARNTGVQGTQGELVVFVDDDVSAWPGWLSALLAGAARRPQEDVFTGPVRPRIEGPPPRTCGRAHPLITSLDLGSEDGEATFAWGANMAIRREALERIGPFDPTLADGGDEQEWQERLRGREPGALIAYVAAAGVDHRRAGADARLRALSRGAFVRGRAARRFDLRRGSAPSRSSELLTLGACVGHVALRRCAAGVPEAAHSAGRVLEAFRPGGDRAANPRAGAAAAGPVAGGARANGRAPESEDFLTGSSGTVGGLDGARRSLIDDSLDAWEHLSGHRRRLARAASLEPPRRRVLAIGVVREEHADRARAIAGELERSRHAVELHTRPAGGRGKFENLNLLLAEHDLADRDWLLVLDDDVRLPRGFLDRFLFLCERFSLALAQPAHRLASHAAWAVTRRQARSVVRETSFVEIGPVTAFDRRTFPVLLPFPELRMGWGLDVHWGALAREHRWRCGVVDAVPIMHDGAPVAASYSHEQAVAEARAFLAERPYLPAEEAQRTLLTHRRW